MNKVRRHGDLPIHTIEKIEGKKIKHAGSFILALGETTGHKHVITTERLGMMDIYDLGNGIFCLDLKGEAKISHEEHKTIKLVPGIYKVGREREHDWFSNATRQVID